MDELEALALALEVEKAEMKFYLDFARKTKDERARKHSSSWLARKPTTGSSSRRSFWRQ